MHPIAFFLILSTICLVVGASVVPQPNSETQSQSQTQTAAISTQPPTTATVKPNPQPTTTALPSVVQITTKKPAETNPNNSNSMRTTQKPIITTRHHYFDHPTTPRKLNPITHQKVDHCTSDRDCQSALGFCQNSTGQCYCLLGFTRTQPDPTDVAIHCQRLNCTQASDCAVFDPHTNCTLSQTLKIVDIHDKSTWYHVSDGFCNCAQGFYFNHTSLRCDVDLYAGEYRVTKQETMKIVLLCGGFLLGAAILIGAIIWCCCRCGVCGARKKA